MWKSSTISGEAAQRESFGWRHAYDQGEGKGQRGTRADARVPKRLCLWPLALRKGQSGESDSFSSLVLSSSPSASFVVVHTYRPWPLFLFFSFPPSVNLPIDAAFEDISMWNVRFFAKPGGGSILVLCRFDWANCISFIYLFIYHGRLMVFTFIWWLFFTCQESRQCN